MKDSLKNTFPLDGKKLMVCTSQKTRFTTRNEAFVEKYVPTIRKNWFFWQKNQKWFSLAGKYFTVKIDSP